MREERIKQEQLEQERIKQEKLKEERIKQEKLKEERIKQEKLKEEKLKEEKLRKEKLREEKLKQERLKQEQLDQERIKQEKLREELKQKLEKERSKSTNCISNNNEKQNEQINIKPVNNNEEPKIKNEISPNVKSRIMDRLNRGKIRAMANSAGKVEKIQNVNKNENILSKAKMLEGVLARGNGTNQNGKNKIEIEYEQNEEKNEINENNDYVIAKKKRRKTSNFEG